VASFKHYGEKSRSCLDEKDYFVFGSHFKPSRVLLLHTVTFFVGARVKLTLAH
jgi:hypothetical protein